MPILTSRWKVIASVEEELQVRGQYSHPECQVFCPQHSLSCPPWVSPSQHRPGPVPAARGDAAAQESRPPHVPQGRVPWAQTAPVAMTQPHAVAERPVAAEVAPATTKLPPRP